MQQQQEYFFEMYRSGLRVATEVMEANTRFAAAQFETSMEHWSRMWRMVGERQASLIGQAQNQVRETYAAIPAANTSQNHERKERKSA